ncbi:MAG: phosphoglucosamine mutase [Acidimicrobiia bacterium]
MTLRFGTDGVRGLANVELTPEAVLALGRAIAQHFGIERPYLMARDTRRSGPLLESALAAGLAAEGANVQEAGELPTPALAWLAEERDCPAVMLTASHNPFGDNGIKVFARGGSKLNDADQCAIESRLQAVVAGTTTAEARANAAVGVVQRIAGATDRYIVQLLSQVQNEFASQRVVVDCANGATYGAAPRVLRELGAIVEVISGVPDGCNINDGCGATHPEVVAAAVVAAGADVGFAFDGDGDRVIAADAAGNIVDGDMLLGMHAFALADRGELAKNAIACTVMSNLGLRRALAERGIELVETPVGDRAILDALSTRGLSLGGEQSGHIVFSEIAPTGDGLLTALLTLELMVRTGKSLANLAAPFVRVPQELRAVRVGDVARLDGASDVWSTVESVRGAFGDEGRVLVRASGTEPVVRVMVEHLDPRTANDTAELLARTVAAALT